VFVDLSAAAAAAAAGQSSRQHNDDVDMDVDDDDDDSDVSDVCFVIVSSFSDKHLNSCQFHHPMRIVGIG